MGRGCSVARLGEASIGVIHRLGFEVGFFVQVELQAGIQPFRKTLIVIVRSEGESLADGGDSGSKVSGSGLSCRKGVEKVGSLPSALAVKALRDPEGFFRVPDLARLGSEKPG